MFSGLFGGNKREVGTAAQPVPVIPSTTNPDAPENKGGGKVGGGSFEEVEVLWVGNARLQAGEYRFFLSPQEPIKGLWNVGVEIENRE